MAPCEWVIDILQEWVNAQGFLTTSLIDRGDPAASDYSVADFTKDSAWHELDLSAIVPAGVKGVAVGLLVANIAVGRQAMFRRHGNVNVVNANRIYSQVAGVNKGVDIVILVDTDRKIDYWLEAGLWLIFEFVIKGWWY